MRELVQELSQAFHIYVTASELAFEILDTSVEERSANHLPGHAVELISASSRRERASLCGARGSESQLNLEVGQRDGPFLPGLAQSPTRLFEIGAILQRLVQSEILQGNRCYEILTGPGQHDAHLAEGYPTR